MTAAKLLEHAARQQREFTLRGTPMASVSVDGTVAGWTEELILRERMWSRSQFASASVAAVRGADFEILPTHRAPHFDIVLADATMVEAARLIEVFGSPADNLFKRRGRR